MSAATPLEGELREQIAAIRERLDRLPRRSLAHLPTPLDRCRRLAAELAGPELYVKRDDGTGLALGGNKSRQLEYVLGEALAEGADCVIQGASSQSNHARQLAAAAAKLGFTAHLLLRQDRYAAPVQGNHLLDQLLGAVIYPIPLEASMVEAKEELAARLRRRGRKPYVVGMGARRSLVLAAVAYVGAFLELTEQLLDRGATPDWVYVTSQGGTQAGLLAGAQLLGLTTRVVGINPVPPDHEAYLPPGELVGLAREAVGALGLEAAIGAADVENRVQFVGPGYGRPSPAGQEALQLLATWEGILLDPVYTAKGFAGLLHDIRAGRQTRSETAVFVHTGGLPALFAYGEELL